MNAVIEMVTFTLLDNASDEQFIQANHHLNRWVQRQPGFQNRTLVKQDNGTWLDMVQWQTQAQAGAAAEKFMEDMAQSECMAMIDPESVVMAHHDIQLAI